MYVYAIDVTISEIITEMEVYTMVKYVKHDKGSKARRKGLVIVGRLPKGKAKAFIKKYSHSVEEYGVLADGMVDIGYRVLPCKANEIWIPFFTQKIAEIA
jgi:hypothetical protein